MSIEFKVGGFYAVSSTVFWQDVFFDEAYTRALMLEGLGHTNVEILSLNTKSSGVIEREIRVRPKFNMPAPVKRILGDSFCYIESGWYDPTDPAFMSKITVPSAPTLIEITTDLRFTDRKSGGADRHVKIQVKSSKFGLKRLVETTSKGILTQQYRDAEAFTQQWLTTNLKGG